MYCWTEATHLEWHREAVLLRQSFNIAILQTAWMPCYLQQPIIGLLLLYSPISLIIIVQLVN